MVKIRKTTNGFSLIELLIVLAIVGMITSLAAPNYSKIRIQSKEKAMIQVGHALQIALESFYMEEGKYPEGTYTATELIDMLKLKNILTQTPKNPFTGSAFSGTDTSGDFEYSKNDGESYYSLIIRGFELEDIDVLTNQ